MGVSAKFVTCTVVNVNGTLVEIKVCIVTLESTHFIFNKCPIHTHGGASAKFGNNSHETDYSAYIGRVETGFVYLPTQLERTLQLYS